MISLSEFWAITKARPVLALLLLAIGALIGCIAQSVEHKLCSHSNVRGETFTVCSE